MAAVLVVPQLRAEPNETTPPQLTGTPFHQVDTLAALSDAVGFPVTEPAALPFDLVNTTYTAYDEGTAEITYTALTVKPPPTASPSARRTTPAIIPSTKTRK